MMQLSFCSVCLDKHPFEEMLRIASGSGYTALELIAIPTWIHADLASIKPSALQGKIREAGMELVALYPGGVDTSSEDAIESCLAYIRRAIEVAEELGVERLVFTGADGHEKHERAIEAYQTLLPDLERAGVRLCLENHYNNQLEYIEDYERLFRKIDSPHVGMTVDTGHFTSSGVDMMALIDRFGDRIGHVHLKDHIGTTSVAIGQGETDNRGVLRKLHSIGYDGYVSLELEVKDYENVERYITEAKTTIEGYIAEAAS